MRNTGSSSRREFIASGASIAAAAALLTAADGATAFEAAGTGSPGVREAPIRPFRIHVPDEILADLRRRIATTRWPEK